MDRLVTFASEAPPLWPAVAELLGARGLAVQMRMIDGELAFPDQAPPEGWRELRLATPGGMVTLRREPAGVALVIWGNAEGPLRQAWNALTWACAQVTGGRVVTPEGEVSADDFRRGAELPEGLRG
ncbi:MAG: hypothetical protein L0Z62_05575 [Gemmataceae bacterium]|nr:hypothetical protein [Gemmataceae bacterium]